MTPVILIFLLKNLEAKNQIMRFRNISQASSATRDFDEWRKNKKKLLNVFFVIFSVSCKRQYFLSICILSAKGVHLFYQKFATFKLQKRKVDFTILCHAYSKTFKKKSKKIWKIKSKLKRFFKPIASHLGILKTCY